MDLPALNRDSLGSPYAQQLKDGFASLRFDGLLEKEFRDAYVEQNLPRGRVSGLIALVLVLAVTCIDFVLGREPISEEINLLRLGVLCPLLILIVLATYHPSLKQYYMGVAAVGVTLVGVIVTYISQIAAVAGA